MSMFYTGGHRVAFCGKGEWWAAMERCFAWNDEGGRVRSVTSKAGHTRKVHDKEVQ